MNVLNGALLTCAIAGLLPAQESELQPTEFQTPDGSRFVLVPTAGPPVVHWVISTPAGPLVDPPEMAGLSTATARAALNGTDERYASNAEDERSALDQQDKLEGELDRSRISGKAPSSELTTKLAAARLKAAGLAHSKAWLRDLNIVPATARMEHVPGGTLLHVTTTVASIPQVAWLLVDRREGKLLRGVHTEFRRVRDELTRQRVHDLLAPVRKEMLALAYPSHPYSHQYDAINQPCVLTREQALANYQLTQHPSLSCHVIAGGFDPADVRNALRRAFVSTSLPDPTATLAPPAEVERVQRRAEVTTGLNGVALGYAVPANANQHELAVMNEWLAGGESSALRSALRRRGHANVLMTITTPFPAAGGMMLLEMQEGPGHAPQSLLDDFDLCVAEILGAAIDASGLERAIARANAATAAATIGPQEIARTLAVRHGLHAVPTEQVLGGAGGVTAAQVAELAYRVLGSDSRTIVLAESEQ